MALSVYKIFIVLCFLTTCLFSYSFGLINGTVLVDKRLVNGKFYYLDYYERVPFIIEITKNGLHLCGGALLAPNVVITAARCISMDAIIQNLQRYYLIAGNQKRNPPQSGPWFIQHRSIVKAVLHPDWPKDQSADLALLKPSLDFEISQYVNTIQMPNPYPSNRPVIDPFIYGWGLTENNKYSSLLRFASTEYHLLSDCSHLSNSTNSLCLWRSDSGPCFGDFGGPLVEVSQDVVYYSTLVGIVSFSNGAKIPGDPTKVDCFNDKRAIAVRIQPFKKWIDSTMNQL